MSTCDDALDRVKNGQRAAVCVEGCKKNWTIAGWGVHQHYIRPLKVWEYKAGKEGMLLF